MIAFLLTLARFVRAVASSLKNPEFQALLFLVVLTLLTGTIFYHNVEGWSLLDSFYFSAITLTTVGYGDLSPSTPVSKIFTVLYLFTGIGIILGFLNVVAKRAYELRRDARRDQGKPQGTQLTGEEPENTERGGSESTRGRTG